MTDVLLIDSLSKSYILSHKKKVLDNVSLRVRSGQCLCIVGPNGTGKSTLLKIIAGLISKESGNVTIYGEIGYVPEVSINFSNLSLSKNVDFYRSMSMNKPINAEYIDMFKLQKTGKRMKHFSKGMKRKFDLIRALNINPDLCVLDEPFEGLDPLTCRDMIDLLRERKDSGLAIIMSSHDMSYVEKLADDVLLLKDGKLRHVDGWKERRISLFIDTLPERIKDLFINNEYKITEEKGMTKLTIPLKDYTKIQNLILQNNWHILREENSSLEEIYLEHIEK